MSEMACPDCGNMIEPNTAHICAGGSQMPVGWSVSIPSDRELLFEIKNTLQEILAKLEEIKEKL